VPLLSVERVTRRFGGIVALDDVSLDANAGEIVGLIGPNGAGKTTVFNLITRVYRPDSGAIRIDGTEHGATSKLFTTANSTMPMRTSTQTLTLDASTHLNPGSYRVEGWGRTSDGVPEKFFERTLAISSATPVVEYYSPSRDHYFMSINPEEVASLDQGRTSDWRRTGQQFKAWVRASDAPANAVPVCRFYALGPDSHFFTASATECANLKALEQQQRKADAAAGRRFEGWGYEGIAFYSILPRDGSCPAGMSPVNRFYNNRYAQNDSNHRFTGDPLQRSAMSVGWNDEGSQFCGPL